MIKEYGARHIIILFLAVVIQLFPMILICQPTTTDVSISMLIDSVQKKYGMSELLVNGEVYYQPNRQALGTPYIFSSQFNEGTIYTRGYIFNVAGLNYNAVDHKVILLNIMPNGARLHIDLSNMLVDSFLLNEYLFVNSNKLNIESNYPYMLVVNNGEQQMLIAFHKEFINRYSQNYPNGKFSTTKHSLFLLSNGNITQINSKKSFLKIFPSSKKEISSFLRRQKINLLEATPEELEKLMDFINIQIALSDE